MGCAEGTGGLVVWVKAVGELHSSGKPTAPMRKSVIVLFIFGSRTCLFRCELFLVYGTARRRGARCAWSLSSLDHMIAELPLKAISQGYCVDRTNARAHLGSALW